MFVCLVVHLNIPKWVKIMEIFNIVLAILGILNLLVAIYCKKYKGRIFNAFASVFIFAVILNNLLK